jgi:hypothetical protein
MCGSLLLKVVQELDFDRIARRIKLKEITPENRISVPFEERNKSR